MHEEIIAALGRLEKKIAEQAINSKEVLNFNEACQYMAVSRSFLYKKTSTNSIPHYCPEGKLIYFKRSDLDQWLFRNRRATTEEREAEGIARVVKNYKSRRRVK